MAKDGRTYPVSAIRGFFVCESGARSEVIVQTGADDVGAVVDVRRDARHADAGPAARLAEIGVEVFDLGGERTGDCGFDPRAAGPAGLPLGRAAEYGRGLQIADSETAGDVGQQAVERVADAAADGAEPVVLELATSRAVRGGRALHAAPVDVAFEPAHDAVSLPVVADGAAEHAAGSVEVAGPGEGE